MISECVTIYIHAESITKLRRLISGFFSDVAFVDYEMFNGKDPFGKMMVRNFEVKGVPLCSIDRFDSLAQIRGDMLAEGYQRVEIQSMRDIYYTKINQEELKRISKLEWIDEFEEFDLMMGHYFVSIAVAAKDEGSVVHSVGFDNLA